MLFQRYCVQQCKKRRCKINVDVSPVLQTSCLVIAGRDHSPDSYKLHQAQTFRVPVVTVSYILNSMQYGNLEDIKKYIIKKYQIAENDTGTSGKSLFRLGTLCAFTFIS